MTYVVLARKYRPRSFSEMVGQEHVVQALGNALTQQRLHHAYLFTGTRGVGKTTVSRILAKSLNCTGPDGTGGITAQPCGVCPACRDIDSGRYVDYVELDAASNRGVDEIGQLLDQAVYKPVVGRFKVYLIDEVHMLSNTAFNAMLKTLEEPPEYLKFVLATTDPQKVPVTVLSRCLQFNLRPMAPETIESHLTQVLGAENVPSEPVALRMIARAARGSMRDALSLTDQAIAFASGQLLEAPVRQMLGAVDRSHVVRFIQALAANDGAAILKVVDQLRERGLSASGFLDELMALVQQIAVAQVVPSALDEADPDAPTVRALVPLLAADELQLVYSIALHGRGELGLAPDEYSGLTMVLLRLMAFRPMGAASGSGPQGSGAGGGRSAMEGSGSSPSSVGASASSTPATRSVAVSAAPVARGAVRSIQPSVAESVRSEPPAAPAAPMPRPAAVVVPASELQAPGRPLPPMAEAARPDMVAAIAPPVPVPVPSTHAATSKAAGDDPPPWLDIPPEDPAEARRVSNAGPSRPPWEEEGEGAPPVSAVIQRPAARPGSAAVSEPETVDAPSGVTAPAESPVRLVRDDSTHQQRWLMVVESLVAAGSVAGMVREMVLQAQCAGIQPLDGGGETWLLNLELASLRQASHGQRLQAAMTELLGSPVRVELRAGTVTDSASRREAAAKAQAQADAEALIVNDPLVQQALQQFPGARIVPGSIHPR